MQSVQPHPRQDQLAGALLLQGVRVVDTSYVLSMPLGAGLLADLGAEVIKIEALHRLDISRQNGQGIWPENQPGVRPWNQGGQFCTINRGKRSFVLDLSKEEGREIFRDLLRISDVVIENYTARVMPDWQLDYPRLKAIRPDIIMLSNNGYGHSGPWANTPVLGTSLEPTTGISHFTGYADDRPWKVGQSYHDFVAAWYAVFAITAALRHRALSGQGQWIDIGMYQLGVSLFGEAVLAYAANGKLDGRIGNRDQTGAVQGVYHCAGDEQWLALTIRNDAEWRSLCDLLESQSWEGDRPPAGLTEAYERHDEVDAILAGWAAPRRREDAVAALRTAGVAAGPVNDARDLMLDPHLRARGFYELVDHDPQSGVGQRPLIGRPWRLSGMPVTIRRPAPALGEANGYVLEQLIGLAPEVHARLEVERLTGELEPLPEPPATMPVDELIRLGRIRRHDSAYRDLLGIRQAERSAAGLADSGG